VSELPGLLDRELEDAFVPWGEGNLAVGGCLRELCQGALDLGLDRFELQAEALQHDGRDTLAVLEDSEK